MGHHRALDIDEILRQIFGCIQTHRDPHSAQTTYADIRRNRRTLSAAARTRRAFTDPALSVLWSELHSLVPLLSLIPSFELTSSNDWDRCHEEYTLHTELLPRDLATLQRYALRVRTVWHMTSLCPTSTIASSVFRTVSEAQDGRALLPVLHELVWDQTSYDETSILSVATSSLHTLELNFQGNPIPGELDDRFETFVRSVSARCRGLQVLRVTGAATVHSLCSVVAWKGLNTLRLVNVANALDANLIHSLSTLECLSSLSIDLGHVGFQFEGHPTFTGFPVLKNLSLRGRPAPTACFLDAILPLHLQRLHIELCAGADTELSPEDSRMLAQARARHMT